MTKPLYCIIGGAVIWWSFIQGITQNFGSPYSNLISLSLGCLLGYIFYKSFNN